MDPTKPKNISLDTIVSASRPLWQRITSGITSLALLGITGYGAMACDKNNGGQDDAGTDAISQYDGGDGSVIPDGGNHPPSAIDDGSVTPPNNTNYNVGDTIPTGFTAPSDPDGDSLDGKVVLSAPTQSFTHEFPLGTLTPGQHYGIDIDTATANGGNALPATSAGTAYTIELVVSDGKGGESKVQRGVTLTDNPVKVTGCNVTGSYVGAGIGIPCKATAPNPSQLTGHWAVSGGPTGTQMSNGGTIATARVMTPADVQLWTYSVTASDGTNTSAPYVITVPVDEHESRLVLNCSGGTSNDMLLQESTVDVVAAACFSGYNPSLKPSASGQPDYVGDVAPSCAQTTLNGVSSTEQTAWKNYNNGTTPLDVFNSCTINFAQVKWKHH